VKKNTRFWLAVVVAPLTVPAYAVVVSLFSSSSLDEIYFVTLAIVGAVSYFGFFVFGLPFVLVLRSKDKLSLTALFLGGAIAGLLFHVFWSILSDFEFAFRWEYFQVLIMMMALSVGVAIVFGLIAKARIS
jgi:hypothetical protein